MVLGGHLLQVFPLGIAGSQKWGSESYVLSQAHTSKCMGLKHSKIITYAASLGKPGYKCKKTKMCYV